MMLDLGSSTSKRLHQGRLFFVLVAAALITLWPLRQITPIMVEQTSIESAGLESVLVKNTAGYGGMVSSILWVTSIFEYAEVLFAAQSPSRLPSLLYASCDADTNWAHSRMVSSWILLGTKGINPQLALPLLMDGARRFPAEWKFRLTWAQTILGQADLDSTKRFDSATSILLPLSRSDAQVPEYARNLAFTLLHKSGKPEEAMDILLQNYAQIPDPLVRFQFQNKIADLLQRNEVSLGASDSTAFFQAIGGMLDSKDPSQVGMAQELLVRLVQPEHRVAALAEAHQLAGQFKAYQKQAAGR
jgi:hypothetical protein